MEYKGGYGIINLSNNWDLVLNFAAITCFLIIIQFVGIVQHDEVNDTGGEVEDDVHAALHTADCVAVAIAGSGHPTRERNQ